MFKIATFQDLTSRFPPPLWKGLRMYQPEPNAFVFVLESGCSDLIMEPLTTGFILFNPYGGMGKLEFRVWTTDSKAQKHFEECRVWVNLEMHDPGEDTKYFLCKIHLPETGWSQEEETRLMERCKQFVFTGEWFTSNPVGSL